MIKSLMVALLAVHTLAGGPTPKKQPHLHHPSPEAKDFKTDDVLTVHVVPHSHDDVGWLKTIDQLFDGTSRDVQWTNIDIQYSSIINALLENPKRKFVVVEIKFFSMWFLKQEQVVQSQTRGLVDNEQLQFATGGWSMHDEACPTYEAMLDNELKGLYFIYEAFRIRPTVGWQIDTFGHSNYNAKLFAQLGYSAWFFARIDYGDKEKRMNDKSLEFVWRPNPDTFGKETEIFTHVLHSHYSSPDGFNFDVVNSDEPWVNNNKSKTFNAPERAAQMAAEVEERAKHYRTNHIFMVFGDDFWYQDAHMNYRNLDNMIAYMNEHYGDKYFFKYSTPAQYVDDIYKLNVTWPLKTDDMFPYSDNPDGYWTGYFSSRPNDKAQVRTVSQRLRALSKLYSPFEFIRGEPTEINEARKAVSALRDTVGIMQHHDAVTGTSKKKVVQDYQQRMFNSLNSTNGEINFWLDTQLSKTTGYSTQTSWEQCLRTNDTFVHCPTAEGAVSLFMAAFNPSSIEVKAFEVLMKEGDEFYRVQRYNVLDEQWEDVPSYLRCQEVKIEAGSIVKACTLVVESPQAMNFDLTLFKFLRSENSSDVKTPLSLGDSIYAPEAVRKSASISKASIESFSDDTVTLVLNFDNGSEERLEFGLAYYDSFVTAFDWDDDIQVSGAYDFRPADKQYKSKPYSKFDFNSSVLSSSYMGGVDTDPQGASFNLVFDNKDEDEPQRATVLVTFNPSLENLLKFEVRLDSLPRVHRTGYEVTVNFRAVGWDHNGTFYTDANGQEMQKRVLNYRPTWDLQNTNYKDALQNVTANYFPVTTAIYLRDGPMQMTVMPDRSQGGSALFPGKIELMQHRRIDAFDSGSVHEPLDERGADGQGIRVAATYHVQIFNTSSMASQLRKVQAATMDPIQLFFTRSLTYERPESLRANFSQLLKEAGVAYPVSMHPVQKLIRFDNLAESQDPGAGNKTVNLTKVARALIDFANERNASASCTLFFQEQTIEGADDPCILPKNQKKWWIVEGDKGPAPPQPEPVCPFCPDSFTLRPMESRNFGIAVGPCEFKEEAFLMG